MKTETIKTIDMQFQQRWQLLDQMKSSRMRSLGIASLLDPHADPNAAIDQRSDEASHTASTLAAAGGLSRVRPGRIFGREGVRRELSTQECPSERYGL